MLIVVGHFVGALLSLVALAALGMWLESRKLERYSRRRLQDAALELGVPVAELEREENAAKVFHLSSQRFSSELLRNRVSDLCGLVALVITVLSGLSQMTILSIAVWGSFENGRDSAVFAWLVVPATLFFWAISAALSFACLLLTGRYPGEAKSGRKLLAEYLSQVPFGSASAAHSE